MLEIRNHLKPLKTNLQDLFTLGKIPYVAATPLEPWSFERRAALFAGVFVDLLKMIVLSIPHLLVAIVFSVIPRAKKSIRGQTALVTGGGNGIGKEIARRLAKEGCNVAVADIDFESAKTTAEELRTMGVMAFPYKVDIADPKEVRQLQQDMKRDLGDAVDILINNAGVMSLISLREGPDEEVDRLVKINLNSHFYTIRTFIPGMIERRRGHIVGMSSMSGVHPTPHSILYTATKFGIQGFLSALHEELRQEGLTDCIRITTAYPYFVSTRQDIMDAVNLRYPPITTERTANATVDGMLRNQHSVFVPAFLFYLTMCMRIMPLKCQELARDYVLRERGTKVMNYNGTPNVN